MSSAITKNIINSAGTAFVTWTVGNAGGGTLVASVAALWLHVFAIYNPTSDIVDIFCDTQLDGSNRPGTYTHARRIGSIYIEDIGSGRFGIKKFRQAGDKITWDAQSLRLQMTGTLAGNTTYDATMLAPLGVITDVYGSLQYNKSTTVAFLRIGSATPPDEIIVSSLGTPGGASSTSMYIQLNTDSSSRIRLREDGGGTGSTVAVYTGGYYDQRGKDA
jgi:hypothetical protein